MKVKADGEQEVKIDWKRKDDNYRKVTRVRGGKGLRGHSREEEKIEGEEEEKVKFQWIKKRTWKGIGRQNVREGGERG